MIMSTSSDFIDFLRVCFGLHDPPLEDTPFLIDDGTSLPWKTVNANVRYWQRAIDLGISWFHVTAMLERYKRLRIGNLIVANNIYMPDCNVIMKIGQTMFCLQGNHDLDTHVNEMMKLFLRMWNNAKAQDQVRILPRFFEMPFSHDVTVDARHVILEKLDRRTSPSTFHRLFSKTNSLCISSSCTATHKVQLSHILDPHKAALRMLRVVDAVLDNDDFELVLANMPSLTHLCVSVKRRWGDGGDWSRFLKIVANAAHLRSVSLKNANWGLGWSEPMATVLSNRHLVEAEFAVRQYAWLRVTSQEIYARTIAAAIKKSRNLVRFELRNMTRTDDVCIRADIAAKTYKPVLRRNRLLAQLHSISRFSNPAALFGEAVRRQSLHTDSDLLYGIIRANHQAVEQSRPAPIRRQPNHKRKASD